jgi:hypothetical protein
MKFLLLAAARLAFALSCVLVFSRGLFELYSSKMIGYGAGIAGLGALVAIALTPHIFRTGGLHRVKGPAQLALLVYALFAIVSLFATALSGEPILVGFLYTSLHLFLMYMLLLLPRNASVSLPELSFALHLTGLVILVSGILQYLGIMEFPGDAFFGEHARISGALGSKQHFSFACATVAMLLAWVHIRSGSNTALALSVALMGLTFLSFSRNGYPIIVGTLALYFSSDARRFVAGHRKLTIVLFLAAVGSLVLMPAELYQAALERALSVASLEDPANAGRVGAWSNGVNAFLQGPIIFGNEVGTYSQAASRLGFLDGSHFESAILQQFANYGVFGGLAFVVFFVLLLSRIKDRFLRALGVMVFLSFFYYPGSESLPFVASWLLIAVAASMSAGAPRKQTLYQTNAQAFRYVGRSSF